jgi:flagellar assembly factor FliW
MGEVAHASEDTSVILFEEGIIGVPRARRFQLLERPGSPVKILRCLDIEGFALPVVDPLLADPGYRPRLGDRVSVALDPEREDRLLLLAVTTLEPGRPVANLRAPLVVNVRRRVGVQVILDGVGYPLRAPVAEMKSGDDSTASAEAR